MAYFLGLMETNHYLLFIIVTELVVAMGKLVRTWRYLILKPLNGCETEKPLFISQRIEFQTAFYNV